MHTFLKQIIIIKYKITNKYLLFKNFLDTYLFISTDHAFNSLPRERLLVHFTNNWQIKIYSHENNI